MIQYSEVIVNSEVLKESRFITMLSLACEKNVRH